MKPIEIRLYRPSDWHGIVPLMQAYPFKPLAGHGNWPNARLIDLWLERGHDVLGRMETSTWIAQSTNKTSGIASLRILPWDSEHIGRTAARLEYIIACGEYPEQFQIKKALLAKLLEHSNERNIQHLSVRIDASDLSSLHVLEHAGFITVDSLLNFAIRVDRAQFDEVPAMAKTRLATSADINALSDLASRAYFYDRFHSDPSIPREQADKLHGAWLRESCIGKAADAVLVVEDGRGLLGFVTCKLHPDTAEHLGELLGSIVLIASDRRIRRQGIARANTMAALTWFSQNGATIVDVGTQLRNIPASRLYESCGFRLVGSSISLHKSL